MSESKLHKDIILTLSKGRLRLFRNNVGVLQDKNGTYVKYGLAVGSHDLIGFKSMMITQDMVGSVIAQFVSIEVKIGKGKQTKQQIAWGKMIKEAGGLTGEARTVDDATDLLK